MIYAVFLLAAALLLLVVYFRFPFLIIGLKKRYARWKAGVRRRVVQVDDHRWVYLDGGKGEAVVLVHGFGGFRWLHQIPGAHR